MLVAAFAGGIAEAMSGMGQEWFNAIVLLAAVVMIGWHVVWMARHGRELSLHMKSVGSAVSAGSRPMTALLVVVALAVLREGSEVVLFGYGLLAGGSSMASLAVGGLLGLLIGVAVGFAMYFGLLKIPMRHFFTATNGLLVLLAAGLASSAAGKLVQADALPTLVDHALGQLVAADRRVAGRPHPAYPGRLHRPAQRHPDAFLRGDGRRAAGRHAPVPSPRFQARGPFAAGARLTPEYTMRFLLILLLSLFSMSAMAEVKEYTLTLRNHKFVPAQLTIPANTKVKLLIVNEDATPEEFESHELNREKIVTGKGRSRSSSGR